MSARTMEPSAEEPHGDILQKAILVSMTLLTPVVLFVAIRIAARFDHWHVTRGSAGQVAGRTREHAGLIVWAALASAVPCAVTIVACRKRLRWVTLVVALCLAAGGLCEVFVNIDPQLPAW